ncbi:enoyl-CoA hydratase/isomerase family protein [Rubrobacter taiwanensis]|jgi:methylglutaconyl-CoA hydratase|uniref:Enoyl-CoA hydratase/isomerase family protein n=1 Tax=Rubrobacter taiwanensis TaxID=185139 RepID=A0A4R1BG52_9ACTN|nr:enoyl-CoA hydratase-related protein [Rubrobacter taiwanensis]TCJ16159.1 enoyl-CoA hydratase/isomerase family protein [Rubrobacter taiwanensis]
MPYENLRYEVEGGVARLTLNRPGVHNALNNALIDEIRQAIEEAGRDGAVRAVVISGAGRSLCAGADIDWLRRSIELSYEENVEDMQRLAGMLVAMDECPKPIVARAHGAVLGGGCGLVAASDIVVAAEGARFGFTEVRLGITPSTIAPVAVAKIGVSAAAALFLTGERFGAERAREIGLVHEVVPEGELDAAVRKKVDALLQGGPNALAEAKRLVRALRGIDISEETYTMARQMARTRTSEEGQEGLRAFLEKRRASWIRA